jgi:hypothetical protein
MESVPLTPAHPEPSEAALILQVTELALHGFISSSDRGGTRSRVAEEPKDDTSSGESWTPSPLGAASKPTSLDPPVDCTGL